MTIYVFEDADGDEVRVEAGSLEQAFNTTERERERRGYLACVDVEPAAGRDVTDDPTSQIGDRTPTDWAGR
jgi:hypothetical protein